MSANRVTIRYRRVPDRLQVFEQHLLENRGGRIVTFVDGVELERPVVVGGRAVLEPGAPVIWLTYPGRWHDVGLFHLADGTFTGYYANVLTPVEIRGDVWDTTDLFLDLWVGVDGSVELLDRDEFDHAVERGWIGAAEVAAAEAEAARLEGAARRGEWPPPEVRAWSVDLARARLRESAAGSTF